MVYCVVDVMYFHLDGRGTFMISTRHIRHDWQTWIEWEQKEVRTLCGVTTKKRLAGIPGITFQDQIVEINGKRKWGWCVRCASVALLDIRPILLGETYYLAPSVRTLYQNAFDEIADAAAAYSKLTRSRPS